MLGARIAGLRREAGFSQAELADRLGISASAVGMYEQGRREPAVDMLVAMAEVFGVTTDYLLTGKPQTENEAHLAQRTVMQELLEVEQQFTRRGRPPFSRQELAVLFAAMLMEP
jgi:transcriptional regulator with XRE-family HTH domain